MSDDKLIEMAREAGIGVPKRLGFDTWYLDLESLEEFEALVRADEREKCALAVEGLFGGKRGKWGSENSDRYHAQDETRAMAAAAIRARSES